MQTRALIAAVFCLALVGCDKPAPAGPSPVQVSVQQPERRAIEIERDFIGEVAAVEEAEIRSKVNGRVLSVEFEEGSLVQQGQPLFRIDSDSLLAALNEAKANVSKAQADQTKVLADQTRYKTLVEKGTISRQAYDDIINKVAQAKAALDAAQAQLNQAQTMMQESAIVSPYNGRIGRAQVKIGELVTANQTLMATVSTTESVRVDFALSERDYLQLVRPILESNQPRPLLPVKLLLADGSLYPESGLITFSDRTISSDTGTFAVAATFPNPQEVLRPGMFGRIRAVVKQIDDALLIPNRAVQEVLDRNFISLVDSSGTVEQREVKLGAQANGFVQIISGLSEGEQVIVDGHHKARPGMQVKAIAIDSPAVIESAAVIESPAVIESAGPDAAVNAAQGD
ncbi:efflux system protein [Cellvibrio sp. BR]|uniref:efflux RND transporter periplasmic adaptor subunit n=1 Tax=Cellvibrio sp. BR TaxID=1134474 RepID=UPI0002601222|nr:efflux RND transporter periplasmic adaptor subunit [Cellvibrio sp. BR]EIK43930.1 efflux system protein [Cellvibrio sp. BR]